MTYKKANYVRLAEAIMKEPTDTWQERMVLLADALACVAECHREAASGEYSERSASGSIRDENDDTDAYDCKDRTEVVLTLEVKKYRNGHLTGKRVK